MGRYAFAAVGLLFISAAVVSLALWTGLIPATAAFPSAAYVVVAGGVRLTHVLCIRIAPDGAAVGSGWGGTR
jgi:hypothetical protein